MNPFGGSDDLRRKGEAEARISAAFTQLWSRWTGRGPEEVHTFAVHDMVVVQLLNLLTPVEQQMAQSEEGQSSVRRWRTAVFEKFRRDLQEIVERATGGRVIEVYSEIHPARGNRVVVFRLDRRVSELLA